MNERDQLAMAEKSEWLPIPRVSRVVPFGYIESPEDSGTLLPVPLELDALEKAKVHLKQFSTREVAQWLEQVTGRYISHVGLKKRVENERYRGKRAQVIRRWAKRYEEAISKAEALETRYIGARTQDTHST